MLLYLIIYSIQWCKMVHIRVKITQHDGASKKEALWQGLHKAKACVYKMIQAKEAFFLVADGQQAKLILKCYFQNKININILT